MLIAIEKKWLRAAHLQATYGETCLSKQLPTERIPVVQQGSAGPNESAVGGCTCGPAVQLGDKAMLPASAMRQATEKLSMLDLNLEIL